MCSTFSSLFLIFATCISFKVLMFISYVMLTLSWGERAKVCRLIRRKHFNCKGRISFFPTTPAFPPRFLESSYRLTSGISPAALIDLIKVAFKLRLHMLFTLGLPGLWCCSGDLQFTTLPLFLLFCVCLSWILALAQPSYCCPPSPAFTYL